MNNQIRIIALVILSLCGLHTSAKPPINGFRGYDIYQTYLELQAKGGNKKNMLILDGLFPIGLYEQYLWFGHLGGMYDSQSALKGSVGIGGRYLDRAHIWGGYLFYEENYSARNNSFAQVTIGGEYLRNLWEARINIYLPISSKQVISQRFVNEASNEFEKTEIFLAKFEQAFHGFDIEVGGQLPPFQPLQGFIGYYHFLGHGAKPIVGVQGRIELRFGPYVALQGELSCDRVRQKRYFIGVKLNYAWGAKKPTVGLARKMTQLVVRNREVMTFDFYGHQSKHQWVYPQVSDEEFKASCATLELNPAQVLSEAIVQKQHRKLMRIHHSDKGGSEEAAKAINRAKANLLSTIKKRQASSKKR